MTTYDVSYERLEGHAKRGKAIQDIINYLGQEEFSRVSELLRDARNNGQLATHEDRQFRTALMLIGVQGYPCRAWFELLFGEPVEASQQVAEGQG